MDKKKVSPCSFSLDDLVSHDQLFFRMSIVPYLKKKSACVHLKREFGITSITVNWRGFLGGEKSRWCGQLGSDPHVVAEYITHAYNVPVTIDVGDD